MYWGAAWMAIGLGSVPTQDLFQRSMSARNESTAVWGTYMAGALYLFFGIMSPLVGIMMFKLDPNLVNPDGVLVHGCDHVCSAHLDGALYGGPGLGLDEHLR
jgi:solute:Na+ symporter, SSS family